MTMSPFTGSYHPDDVHFLLKPIELEDTPISQKETLIQSGQKHYSELLSHEKLPESDYVRLFHEAMASNQKRVAEQLCCLAEHIHASRPAEITLVSLARAGTPFGVLLKHILARYFKRKAAHYSISIIRDIGIDFNALSYLVERHPSDSLVFIDGWTGKGVIAAELATSLKCFERIKGITIPNELYVLSDLSGSAQFAASFEDDLIPSCLLNSTISGLVSRSIYSKSIIRPNDFHACVYYENFEAHDLSNYFVKTILAAVEKIWPHSSGLPQSELNCRQMQNISKQFLIELSQRYGVTHSHYIKPGIGEASRVLLRREARILLLKNQCAEATKHLRWLAESKNIPIEQMPDCPYQAVALIKEIHS